MRTLSVAGRGVGVGLRIGRVLVAVDFGTPSLAAARWVARNLAPDAEVVLAHVLPVPAVPPFLRGHLRAPDAFVQEVTAPMRGGLDGLAEALGAAHVRTELRVGQPAAQLAELAALHDVDLICVGRPRGRGDTVKLGRNTVDRLLRKSPVPVLQASGPLATPPSALLAAVDGGVASEQIVRTAWALAARHEARLTTVHVLDDDLRAYVRAMEVAAGAAAGAAADARRAEEALRSTTSAWLADMLRNAGARTGRSDVLVGQGDPGQEILGAARKLGADLIVLGRDGHDALSPDTVGSTTRLILRAAVSPVLVLPGIPEPSRPSGPGPGWGRRQASMPLSITTAVGPVARRQELRSRPGDDGMPPAA